MGNIVERLYDLKLTNLGGHHWLAKNMHYITMMGSVAYGVSSETSDVDVYSFCIPPLDELFPHLRGEIIGFGEAKGGNNRFRMYQQHHIQDAEADKQYDLNIYNIVDFFQLVMENNPNMVDSLFTPDSCVLHITRVGQMVRERRKMFLHLGCWHTFKGYAFAQMKKARSQNRIGKRKEIVEELGYDPKFAYHIVRLIYEVEQILMEGDIDLQRHREHLKAIRRGDVNLDEIEVWFSQKELALEKLYNENPQRLPWGPQDSGLQDKIKRLLVECLEEHYGSLSNCIVNVDAAVLAIREVNDVLRRYRSLIDGQ